LFPFKKLQHHFVPGIERSSVLRREGRHRRKGGEGMEIRIKRSSALSQGGEEKQV